MSDKPRISYSDLCWQLQQREAWLAAFARIENGDKLSADGITYLVDWKHEDPLWVRLAYRAKKKLAHKMCRLGDPLLLALK